MRIAVVGAGGVGGYFGGLIARTNQHDVWFIARGSHLQRLQEDGLKVISPHGDFQIPVQATHNPNEIGQVDLVLYCVKTYSDEQSKSLLIPLIGQETAVISLQNGVEKEAKLSSLVGREKVIGGVCYIESAIKEPGVIEQKSARRDIIIGELDGSDTARIRNIEQIFAQAGIPVQVSFQIVQEIWKKFIFLSSMSAITTITRSSIGPIRENPITIDLFRQLVEEAWQVAKAHGIEMDEKTKEEILQIFLSFAPDAKSSMLKDYEKGNPLEVEDLSGAVYRLGKSKGVPTPVHQTIYGALSFLQKLLYQERVVTK